jgi:hypothetical protein
MARQVPGVSYGRTVGRRRAASSNLRLHASSVGRKACSPPGNPVLGERYQSLSCVEEGSGALVDITECGEMAEMKHEACTIDYCNRKAKVVKLTMGEWGRCSAECVDWSESLAPTRTR